MPDDSELGAANLMLRRRASILLGVLFLLVVIATVYGLFQPLENKFYDLGFSVSGRKLDSRIKIVAIDEKSIAQFGQSAWSPGMQSRLIDMLSAAGAKVIVNGVASQPGSAYQDDNFTVVAEIAANIAREGVSTTPAVERLVGLVLDSASRYNGRERLLESYRRSASVLVPMWSSVDSATSSAYAFFPSACSSALRSKRGDFGGAPLVKQLFLNPPLPCQFVDRAAYVSPRADAEGMGRREAVLVRSESDLFPSLPLLAAARSLDIGIESLEVTSRGRGLELRVGRLRVPVTADFELYPFQYPVLTDQSFALLSLSDVISGKAPAKDFSGKVVLIGVTVHLPGLVQDVSVVKLANSISSILQGDSMVVPAWGRWLALVLAFLVVLYLFVELRRLSSMRGWLVSGLVCVLLITLQLGLMLWGHYWLPLISPLVVLIAGHSGCVLLLRSQKHEGGFTDHADRRMGNPVLAGEQGLDLILAQLTTQRPRAELKDNLYAQGLRYERQGLVDRAAVVFSLVARLESGESNDIHQSGVIVPPHCGVAFANDSPAPECLGRYRLERVLGKGAMGVVYFGRDPKINRVVALKTMNLASDVEADELDEVRQRFFREAETAGRLSHPNIVTIYDVGEENGLAYIAMEYLEGRDLLGYCKPGCLLPLDRVLEIVAQIADALDYAHRNQIVHRDIKPANIMYLPEIGVVKVTDFGIARITDSSRTRTGMVLGTPSYMSPEQLAGAKVDGRADLYSLTVMLYQLICGGLPFVGESLAQLMYKITKEAPIDILSIKPDLPVCVLSVIEKGLNKQLDSRFQQGSEMSLALRACVDKLKVGTVQ
ncbi:MAG: CHASE2 domain-containing protein [Rhodocyclales bacterium GT-UBC]|nr:MAG: CHASE2 domain-containing protein [Rhodocyclales bacterium GT-UBC]